MAAATAAALIAEVVVEAGAESATAAVAASAAAGCAVLEDASAAAPSSSDRAFGGGGRGVTAETDVATPASASRNSKKLICWILKKVATGATYEQRRCGKKAAAKKSKKLFQHSPCTLG